MKEAHMGKAGGVGKSSNMRLKEWFRHVDMKDSQ